MSKSNPKVSLHLPKPTPNQEKDIEEYISDVVQVFKENCKKLRPWHMVREFHKAMGQPVGDEPHFLDYERLDFRLRLIYEEINEFLDALEEGDLTNTFKEMADIIYVIEGLAVEMGGDLDAVLDEVHRSNMTKIGSDGKVRYRDDGKVLKPDTYEPADIQGVLF